MTSYNNADIVYADERICQQRYAIFSATKYFCIQTFHLPVSMKVMATLHAVSVSNNL